MIWLYVNQESAMRKIVIAALVAVATIGSVALTPSTASADDWHGRSGWRYGGRHHHNHWNGGWYYPSYWYRSWAPSYYYYDPYYYGSYYYAPYRYYSYPRTGFYLNFRF